MNKRLYILGGIALALIVAVVVLMQIEKHQTKVPVAGKQPQQVKGIAKTDVDHAKLPDNFPTDIPLEKDAVITQNYNAANQGGYQQATRAFVTKATLTQNLALYKDYLTKAGYKIANTIDQANYKMIYGIKDNTALQISIGQNSVTKDKTVTINYTIIK